MSGDSIRFEPVINGPGGHRARADRLLTEDLAVLLDAGGRLQIAVTKLGALGLETFAELAELLPQSDQVAVGFGRGPSMTVELRRKITGDLPRDRLGELTPARTRA